MWGRPGYGDDGIALRLGWVLFGRSPLAGRAGEAFPAVPSPGSAAVSVCPYGPVLGSMWTPD